MELPEILQGDSVTRLLQGACVGAIATAVIGFTWGGWTRESTAKEMADKSASSALVTALAPLCAEKFQQASDARNNMVELKKVSSWMQDTYIQKGGWATFAGTNSSDLAIARACASLLTDLK
jgi:hypothetical protein